MFELCVRNNFELGSKAAKSHEKSRQLPKPPRKKTGKQWTGNLDGNSHHNLHSDPGTYLIKNKRYVKIGILFPFSCTWWRRLCLSFPLIPSNLISFGCALCAPPLVRCTYACPHLLCYNVYTVYNSLWLNNPLHGIKSVDSSWMRSFTLVALIIICLLIKYHQDISLCPL